MSKQKMLVRMFGLVVLVGLFTQPAAAQGCSDLTLEVHYSPVSIVLMNGDDPYCAPLDASNDVDIIIPILFYADFPFSPNVSTFDINKNTGTKYAPDGTAINCEGGYNVGHQFYPPNLVLVGIKNNSSPTLGDDICFDVVIEGIGTLDPRAKVVSSAMMSTRKEKEAARLAARRNKLANNTEVIIREALGLDPDDYPPTSPSEPTEWVWDDANQTE